MNLGFPVYHLCEREKGSQGGKIHYPTMIPLLNHLAEGKSSIQVSRGHWCQISKRGPGSVYKISYTASQVTLWTKPQSSFTNINTTILPYKNKCPLTLCKFFFEKSQIAGPQSPKNAILKSPILSTNVNFITKLSMSLS